MHQSTMVNILSRLDHPYLLEVSIEFTANSSDSILEVCSYHI